MNHFNCWPIRFGVHRIGFFGACYYRPGEHVFTDSLFCAYDDTAEEPQLEKVPELGGYYTEVEYFYDCLEKDTEPSAAPLEEGIRTVRLALKELEEAHRFLG